MSRQSNNKLLHKAKKNKNDEFYTLYEDIERELIHYSTSGQFQNACVYCNCDDPCKSNFYRYFAINFEKLGLRKLIASCISNDELNPHGFYYIYTGDETEAIIPSMNDVTYFEGNGDFNSKECLNFLNESDIIVTNPPFSLFRDFVNLIVNFNKKFLIIGNVNAITYKEIFKLIQDNNAWLGINLGRGISGFIVPETYPLYGTETKVDPQGNRIVATNGCLWLTNLDHNNRHKDIPLEKVHKGHEMNYPKYDNFDGINIDKTKNIPADYSGAMGVPITFLHKYNPKQFEIIKFRKGDDEKDLAINGKCPYFRILIRRRIIQKDSV